MTDTSPNPTEPSTKVDLTERTAEPAAELPSPEEEIKSGEEMMASELDGVFKGIWSSD